MKSTSLRWLLVGLLCLTAGVVHAEGGCPPGMIPASGTDINSCVPIPPGYYSNQAQNPAQSPQPPLPRWKDSWGAIATALPKGILGVSNNLPSERQAAQAALADCQSKGGTTCKLESTYGNACDAMIVGHPGYAIAAGASENEAIQKAMKMCTDGGDANCHVYYSACSLPQRIQ
jgi:hypothetical protein